MFYMVSEITRFVVAKRILKIIFYLHTCVFLYPEINYNVTPKFLLFSF